MKSATGSGCITQFNSGNVSMPSQREATSADALSPGPRRISKKGGRHYTNPKQPHPANRLMPSVSRLLTKLFPMGPDGPSVTTVLGVMAKPALIGWASKEERKLVAMVAANLYQRLPEIVDGIVSPAKFYELLVEEAGKPANRRLLEKAANVGTEVHARIEWEFKAELGLEHPSEPPALTSAQAERSFDRWKEWRAQVKLKVLKIEQRLYSSVFGYGGTLDFLAEMRIPLEQAEELLGHGLIAPEDGLVTVVVVGDFKTGKAIYAESYLQNVAYRAALQEEGIHTDGGIIIRLPKYEDDPEFEARMVPNDPDLFPTFLALLVVYQWWSQEHHTKGGSKGKVADKGASLPIEKGVD